MRQHFSDCSQLKNIVFGKNSQLQSIGRNDFAYSSLSILLN